MASRDMLPQRLPWGGIAKIVALQILIRLKQSPYNRKLVAFPPWDLLPEAGPRLAPSRSLSNGFDNGFGNGHGNNFSKTL